MCLVEHKGICCVYDMVYVSMGCWHREISVYNLWLPFGYVCISAAEHVLEMLS